MQDQQAFIDIIKQNEGIIYKITRLYTNDEADQKDLYQEIVFNLWKGFKGFRGEAKISTWIYRIALNTSLFHSKQNKKQGNKLSLDGIELIYENYDPLLEERLKILYSNIKSLNDVDRGIIFLFLEGKNYEEISVVTGLSISNVGTRMARIKEKLRTQINKN